VVECENLWRRHISEKDVVELNVEVSRKEEEERKQQSDGLDVN
jgi:hypothetical protein